MVARSIEAISNADKQFPFPYTLEHLYMPDVARVLDGVKKVTGYS